MVHEGQSSPSFLSASALLTAHSLRLSSVFAARGLDVNPVTIAKFVKAGPSEAETVKALEIIHSDEVTHVTAGESRCPSPPLVSSPSFFRLCFPLPLFF